MPHKKFHSCDLKTGLTIVGTQHRTSGGKKYMARIGKKTKQSKTSSEHSYLYPTADWSEAQARTHCREHGGEFLAAEKGE